MDLTLDEAIAVGQQFFEARKFKESEQWFRGVLKAEPDNIDAMWRLGASLIGSKQYYESLYLLQRALKKRPSPHVMCNLGVVLGMLKHHDEAIPILERATGLDPNNAVLWSNLGNAYLYLERFEDAEAALHRALEIDPAHTTTHYNIGMLHFARGEIDAGLARMDIACGQDPNNSDAHFNAGIAKLLKGDFSGFVDYEYRWTCTGYDEYQAMFPQPKWLGDPPDLTGKSLMIYGDQGLGDLIFFARYMPFIKATGAHVYAALHGPLRQIFEDTFPWIQATGELGDVDYRLPLPSAPLAFGTKSESDIPPPVKFKVSNGLLAKWANAINSPLLRVGVCWSGNWQHMNDKDRSIPFRTFADLLDRCADLPVNFYSLQAEVRRVDQLQVSTRKDLIQFPLETYQDTAAAIDALDLVVSVDTSVAHMAATQGVPTMTLLPHFRGDWRWQRERADSPWYPTMHLLRQPVRGDWASVFEQVASQIEASSRRRAA